MPTLVVTNIKQAREFYGRTLGLEELEWSKSHDNEAMYEVSPGNYLYLYMRAEPSGSTATTCGFVVENVEEVVNAFRKSGVTFEEYDLPEMDLKTKNGIAEIDGMKSAWFRDPFGNILAIDDSLYVIERRGFSARSTAEQTLRA